MASTVKIPLLGQQNKGTVVGVTVGGFAVAGYLIYRSRKKAQAQAAAAQTASAQAASGYGYGQAYGYGQPPGGYYGYGEPGIGSSGGFYPGYFGYGTPESTPPIPNATNAQWAQASINQLTSEGYDAMVVSAALGAYLLGQTVSPQQQTIIQSAIGIEGYPPQPGANGYPPGIHVQGTPGGGGGGGQGGGGGGSGKLTIPSVVGDRANEGLADLKAAGFKARTVPMRNPRKVYTIVGQSPPAGTQAARGAMVTVNVQAEQNNTVGSVPPGGGGYQLP